MEHPLVSVITVSYNSERFIRDAIESVLCQSYQNLELIISDDASKDNTWNIINEYKDSRIKAYRNETNIGEYPNRNKAVNHATGEYLIFIDGDDMIYPHGLEFMVKMLHAFPDCGMALMQWYRKNLFYPVVLTPEQLYTGIYFGYGFNNIAFANVLVRSSALKAIGGLTMEFKNGDDHARLTIGGKHNTLLINDNLTWWRETEGQASSKFVNSVSGIQTNYELHQSFLDAPDCPLKMDDKAAAGRNMKLAVAKIIRRFIMKGKIKDALSLVKTCRMSFSDCLLAFSNQEKRDPFAEFTPEKPLKLNWEKNPYSKI